MREHERRFFPMDGGDGEDTSATALSEKKLTARDIAAIISPEYLRAISEAGGDFRFIIDTDLGPKGVLAFTDMKTRVIHLNPHFTEQMTPEAIMGLLTHEAGHHAPSVVKLQDKFKSDLARPDIIPEDITDDPELVVKILRALSRHLQNGLSDVWLESFMGRRPHRLIQARINATYEEMPPRETLKMLPKPEQLVQVLVGEDRYPGTVPIKDLVDADVYAAYKELKRQGAIDTIRDRRVFESYFAKDEQHDRLINRKFEAYRTMFLPAWLDLFKKEVEERKQEQQEPTDEVLQQLMKELAEELEKLGATCEATGHAHQEKDGIDSLIDQIAKGKEKKPAEEAKERPEDAIRRRGDELYRDLHDRRRRGEAESMGIRIESVRQWEEIKRERAREIAETTAAIADVFLDDRRKRLQYLVREGEIVPGLEYEYIGAVLGGDVDPKTQMRQVQNPDFLETEVEFIQDVSGSMSGEPLRRCIELQVILCEAFRKVREDLAAEQLLNPQEEEPLRIGVTKFQVAAERVKKLQEPMTDEVEMRIIDELTKGGGSTNEEQALTDVYGELKLHTSNILKIIVVLSDGHGNRSAVQRIMQQIEEDNEVIVAAVGLGSDAKAVVEAYTSGLSRTDESNIHGFEEEDPAQVLPDLIEFFKQEIQKRRRHLT